MSKKKYRLITYIELDDYLVQDLAGEELEEYLNYMFNELVDSCEFEWNQIS